MYILCNQHVRFTLKNGELLTLPNGFIGNVDDELKEDVYFQLLVRDGKIAITDSLSDKKLQKAEEKSTEQVKENQELNEKQKKLDIYKAEVLKKAKAECEEQGLDKVSSERFIKEYVKEKMLEYKG